MGTSTPRLGLYKPDTTENVRISDINDNSDKLDAEVGAQLVVAGSLPTAPYEGKMVFETDSGALRIRHGSQWRVPTIGATYVSTKESVGTPFNGQLVYETSTDLLWVREGSSWMLVGGPGTATRRYDNNHYAYEPKFNEDIVADANSPSEVARINIEARPYFRVLDISIIAHLTYTQTGRVEAAIYQNNSMIARSRMMMSGSVTSERVQVYNITMQQELAVDASTNINLRIGKVDGTGIVRLLGGSLFRFYVNEHWGRPG